MTRMGQGQVIHKHVDPTCHGPTDCCINKHLLSEYKIEANIATGDVLSQLKNAKIVFSRGSVPDPAGGAHDAPQCSPNRIGWGGDNHSLPIPYPFPTRCPPHRRLRRLGVLAASLAWKFDPCAPRAEISLQACVRLFDKLVRTLRFHTQEKAKLNRRRKHNKNLYI